MSKCLLRNTYVSVIKATPQTNEITGDIIPSQDNTFTVGSEEKRFRDGFFVDLHVDRDLTTNSILPASPGGLAIGNESNPAGSVVSLSVNTNTLGAVPFSPAIQLTSDLVPAPGNNINLGSAVSPFNEVYANHVITESITAPPGQELDIVANTITVGTLTADLIINEAKFVDGLVELGVGSPLDSVKGVFYQSEGGPDVKYAGLTYHPEIGPNGEFKLFAKSDTGQGAVADGVLNLGDVKTVNASFTGNVSIDSNSVVNINAPLSVVGPVTLEAKNPGDELKVTMPVDINSSLSVTGPVTFDEKNAGDELKVAMPLSVAGPVTLEANAPGDELKVTMDVNIEAPLSVTGGVTLEGKSVGDNLTVTMPVGITGSVTIDGKVGDSVTINTPITANIGPGEVFLVQGTGDGKMTLDLPVDIKSSLNVDGVLTVVNGGDTIDVGSTLADLPYQYVTTGPTPANQVVEAKKMFNKDILGGLIDGERPNIGSIDAPWRVLALAENPIQSLPVVGSIRLGNSIRTVGRAELWMSSRPELQTDILFSQGAQDQKNILWSMGSRSDSTANQDYNRFRFYRGPKLTGNGAFESFLDFQQQGKFILPGKDAETSLGTIAQTLDNGEVLPMRRFKDLWLSGNLNGRSVDQDGVTLAEVFARHAKDATINSYSFTLDGAWGGTATAMLRRLGGWTTIQFLTIPPFAASSPSGGFITFTVPDPYRPRFAVYVPIQVASPTENQVTVPGTAEIAPTGAVRVSLYNGVTFTVGQASGFSRWTVTYASAD